MVSPSRGQEAYFPPSFLRQGSIYNLNESHISGPSKPFNAMHVDEFGNTVISPEQQQIYDSVSSPPSSSMTVVAPLRGSYNLEGTIGNKTFGEDWRDIVSDEKPATILLENYLIRTGAMGLGGAEGESQTMLDPVVQQQTDWLHYHLASAQQQQQQMSVLGSSMPVFGNAIMNGGFTENQQIGTPMVSMSMVRPSSSDMHAETTDMNRSDETIDKSLERRQKRMIKNRESAARSRAKKQAYINELEKTVKELKIEITLLRKKKELEEKLSQIKDIPEPRHQLRRTSSALF